MSSFRIALLPGDGVGKEVVNEGVKILKTIEHIYSDISFHFMEFDWGSEYYLKYGTMMPNDALKQLEEFDAILLGSVGDSRVPDHISLWGMLLSIRRGFNQYLNIRPIRLIKGLPKILNGISEDEINMTFIRENTEGEYSNTGAWLYRDEPNEIVVQNNVFSRTGTERIIRYAFNLASEQNKKLTSITKSNAQTYSMVFWDQIFNEISQEYPDVVTEKLFVDAAAMYMIKEPSRFEVVVASNLFGDILTDIGAAISGGMGVAASANINPTKKYPSMFEPIHGAALDIAGQNIANPIATILSCALMLEFFGLDNISEIVVKAVENVIGKGENLTKDLGGNTTTSHVGNLIKKEIESIC